MCAYPDGITVVAVLFFSQFCNISINNNNILFETIRNFLYRIKK